MRGTQKHTRQQLQDEFDKIKAQVNVGGALAGATARIDTVRAGLIPALRLAAEIGTIEAGKRADLVLLDAPSYLHLVYHFGVNLVRDVLRDGRFVVQDQRLA